MKKILHLKYLWAVLAILLLVIVYAHRTRAETLTANQSSKKELSHTQQFINFLSPKVQAVNQTILKKRHKLSALYQSYLQRSDLTTSQQAWLKQLAKHYKVNAKSFNHKSAWQALLNRVDIIPTSMVIAQAANESAWGRSRFAKQGNNYFGQHCYKQGCGIVPRRRKAGSKMEVAKFVSVKASIQSYMHNLNTHSPYKKLRQMRAQMRADNKKLNGYQLAEGLKHYSKLDVYVQSIRNIIDHYHLEQLDNH